MLYVRRVWVKGSIMINGGNEEQKKMREFSFTEDRCEGKQRFYTLKGRISTNEATYMQSVLDNAFNAGCTHIVINMSLVYLLSSAGIRVILGMYKRLKKIDGKLQIEAPSENVKNVLGMTALDELLAT